jgi:thioredoxin reductase (NADPH)
MSNHFDIIIVGGGPAGLTAAVYARRANKSVLLLERSSMGGQIATSPRVDNFPAAAGLSGAELSDRLYAQAEELGARIELEEALEIRSGDIKTVITDYSTYTAKAIILATGMNHRTLGLPGEDTLSGISYCAVCDGAFYENKHVAVCGGGNSAVQEALFLCEICAHVTLIHRRSEFRADPILVDKVFAKSNITVLTDTVVEELESKDGALCSLRLVNKVTGSVTSLPIDGLFEAVGHIPETALAAKLGITEENQFVHADESCKTTAEGIFVAGDCREKKVRQMLTACADGAIAALAACDYCG